MNLPNEADIEQFFGRNPQLRSWPRRTFRGIMSSLRNNCNAFFIGSLVLGCGLNVVLSVLLPYVLYLGLTFTYFGLYSLDKLRVAFTPKRGLRDGVDIAIWLVFAGWVAFSDLYWWHSLYGVYMGSPALFSVLGLLAIQDKTLISSAVRRSYRGLRGTRPAATPAEPETVAARAPEHV
jgi:hypothetical protein